jgi:hypothetical protein
MTRTLMLKKIIEIQEITLREKKRGASQQWVYEHLVRDQYFISYSTYNRYLSRNAKAELKQVKHDGATDIL